MRSPAAKPFNNVLLEENWTTLLGSKTKKEAKVAYLMTEEITPPAYMWDKISNELNSEIQNPKKMHNTISNKTIIGLLVGGGILSIALMLYFLL